MNKRFLGISSGITLLIFLILMFVSSGLGKSLQSQTAAARWSKEGGVSQVSCFFSVNSDMSRDRIEEFEHSIDPALTDASVQQESENPSARLWVDAYSAGGQINISSDKSSLTANAIGIGGDFFLFHPLELLDGAYFTGNDLMTDYCILDQDAAWQLFGSNDVAGMTVYIAGIPHMVTGVVKRPEGRLYEAAGLDSTLVYVTYDTLSSLGRNNGINHYEVLMPNPVTGFAKQLVQEKLGGSEKETEVLENTTRYNLLSRLKLLAGFGTRSMNGKAIIYPYWENVARGLEDILAVVTLFELVFLLYAIVVALVLFILWWRHKGWTIRDKWLIIRDKAERKVEDVRLRRSIWKKGKEEKVAASNVSPVKIKKGRKKKGRKLWKRNSGKED